VRQSYSKNGWACKKDDSWHDGIKGSNKVGKWKSCHQKREIEHCGVTMAMPLWSHVRGVGGRNKIGKTLKLLRSQVT
jgi:hypothetical protein